MSLKGEKSLPRGKGLKDGVTYITKKRVVYEIMCDCGNGERVCSHAQTIGSRWRTRT